MKQNRIITLTVGIFAVRALCFSAVAQEEKEEKIAMDKVPAAAAAALKSAAGDSKITGVEVEDDKGKKVYEAAFTVNGHKREVAVSPDGAVQSTEDTMSLSEVPDAAVKSAIKAQAAGGKVKSVERAEEKGKVSYEAKIGNIEYKYSADGKLLGKETQGKDEKD